MNVSDLARVCEQTAGRIQYRLRLLYVTGHETDNRGPSQMPPKPSVADGLMKGQASRCSG